MASSSVQKKPLITILQVYHSCEDTVNSLVRFFPCAAYVPRLAHAL